MIFNLSMKKLIDYILEHISNTTIFEMAYDRRRYCDAIFNLHTEIVQNWCLVKYCNMFDEENYNRLHWSKELTSYLEKLQNVKLKSGDKLRATKLELIESAELDDEEEVFKKCRTKWLDENLPLDKLNIVAKEFVNEIENICKYICDPRFDIRNYAYNEI